MDGGVGATYNTDDSSVVVNLVSLGRGEGQGGEEQANPEDKPETDGPVGLRSRRHGGSSVRWRSLLAGSSLGKVGGEKGKEKVEEARSHKRDDRDVLPFKTRPH